jgi:TATA-box binding protein (TBP) (component of TFIID and TFIIIB)
MITSPYIPHEIRNFNSLDDDNSESVYKPPDTPEMEALSEIESNKKPSQTQKDLNNGEIKVNEEKETADKTLFLISNFIEPIKIQMEETILSPNMDLPEPILEYIVGSFSVNKKLNIHQIAAQCLNVEYKKSNNFVIMKVKKPTTTMIIFQSGKIICTGGKTIEDSKNAAKKCAKFIKKCEEYNDLKWRNDFKVVHLVGSCDFKFKISLSKLSAHIANAHKIDLNQQNKSIEENMKKDKKQKRKYVINYDPDVPNELPSVKYQRIINNVNYSYTIFNTGKVKIFGAKQMEDFHIAIIVIYHLLKKFEMKEDIGNKEKKTIKFITKKIG